VLEWAESPPNQMECTKRLHSGVPSSGERAKECGQVLEFSHSWVAVPPDQIDHSGIPFDRQRCIFDSDCGIRSHDWNQRASLPGRHHVFQSLQAGRVAVRRRDIAAGGERLVAQTMALFEE
jgi:hypothetical protein